MFVAFLKEAQSYLFNFFSKLLEILLSLESSYFSITGGKIYCWKVFRLDNDNENVTGYGNHN